MGTPSDELQRARRSVDGAPGVVDVGRWYFDGKIQRWTLDVRLRHGALATALIPAETVWHVVVDDAYPWGEVHFYPASKEGIRRTHQHQRFNAVNRRADERGGEICVTRPDRATGRVGDDESYDAGARLAFGVERALCWLRDAAQGNLAFDGEWFELPDFPGATSSIGTLAFLEDAKTLAAWGGWPTGGVATLRRYGSVRLVTSFAPAKGAPFREADWGAVGDLATEREVAIWLRVEHVPVSDPWHPPHRFSELVAIFLRAGRDLVREITDIATWNGAELRDGRRHDLLVGFPVPRRVGASPERMHWQALRLPQVTSGKSIRGFRPGKVAYHQLDRAKVLRNSLVLDWTNSENWMDDNITSRGALPTTITSGRLVVIGCGALGSVVAELLVRAGCTEVVLIDHERFEAGNAVRHTLVLDSVGQGKAGDVAKRLNLIRPSVRIRVVHEAFPPTRSASIDTLIGASIVVDTTGSDVVIESVGTYGWDSAPVIVSLSLGYGARRLFCYTARAGSFSADAFRAALRPWLELERSEVKEPFPRAGIGCWHPVFPARADDVWLMAAAGVKCVEGAAKDPSARLRVFEQPCGEGDMVGLCERPAARP